MMHVDGWGLDEFLQVTVKLGKVKVEAGIEYQSTVNIRLRDIVTYTSEQLIRKDVEHGRYVVDKGDFVCVIRVRNQQEPYEFKFTNYAEFILFLGMLEVELRKDE